MRTLWRMRVGRMGLFSIGLVAAGVIAGSAVTAITGASVFHALPPAAAPVVYAQGPANLPVSFKNGFVSSVDRAAPAVVNVFSERVIRVTQRQQPTLPPFFRQFFGDGAGFYGQPVPRNRIEQSLGSGVIVSSDGYILTNAHVVEAARQVRVAMANGREFNVKIVGADTLTDVAVLKGAVTGLPVIPMGDSSKVQVGDFALAIGNPYGVGQTVTQGIISATGRHPGITALENFLQTDAAINKGNSGGALTNYAGELIGLNTAIVSPSGGFEGIGFALPVNMARFVMKELIQHGYVIRGYLGVTVQEVTPELARTFGLPHAAGALVADVSANSPAARARLQRGDVITAVNGKPVTDPDQLQRIIAGTRPGTQATLRVFRNGREENIPVTVVQMPRSAEQPTPSPAPPSGTALEGVTVEELTPEIVADLKIPQDTRGVVVTHVAEGTPAAFAGLDRGTVIQEVNHRKVTSVGEYTALVRQAAGRPVLLLVLKDGVNRYVVVSLPGQEPLP